MASGTYKGRFLSLPRHSRSFLVFVCVLISLSAIAQPGPLTVGPTRDTTGELQIWGWNIAAASLNKLVPAFNERYPHIVPHVNMTGTNLQSRFLLSLSAGVGAPDISQLQLREAPRYSITQKLTDLTPLASKYANAFPPSFWDNCLHEGKIYAIPWDMGPCAVFYKTRIFEQYGIQPDTIETWDDFIEAGKTLLDRSQGKIKLFILPTGSMDVMFEILLQQNGGQIFDEEGRIAINSPQVRDVIDLLRRFLESGVTANVQSFSHAFYAAIRSDMVATFPLAAWFGGTIKDYAPDMAGQWGVFRLPAQKPGNLRTSNLGGSVLVIPDQCTQKEAAWAFIEYTLCTPEAQIEQYRNFDLFPGLLSTHQDPFFDQPDPYFSNQPVRRLFSQDIFQIPTLNYTMDWFEAVRYVTQALSKWSSTGMGPTDELLAQLEAKMSRRLGREIAPKTAEAK